jgi:hypothetical protein
MSGKARGRSPGKTAGDAAPKAKDEASLGKEGIFTLLFLCFFGTICFFHQTAFLMSVCIGTAFASLCFIWEAKKTKRKTDDKSADVKFFAACAVAMIALVVLSLISGTVHTNSSLAHKLNGAFPDAKRTYEFCRIMAKNVHTWAAEDNVDIEFLKQTEWSKLFE